MRSFILLLPAKLQAVVIIVSTVVAAFVVSLVTCAGFNGQQLVLDSTWTIAVYGTLGTLYSGLIAFVVTGVWQSFSAAEAVVNSEANALTDVVFLIRYLRRKNRPHSRVGPLVRRECRRAMVFARPCNPRKPTRRGNQHYVVEPIGGCNSRGQTQGDRELELYAQALDLTAIRLDARRNRLRNAKGNTAGALWGLLIAGAFVLFAFHGLFVTHAWVVWAVLLPGFSLVVGLSFYSIFSLDSPFSGRISAGPEPFVWLLQAFDRRDGFGL